MSNTAAISLSLQMKRVAEFFDKFIEICPDDLWTAPFGKFPIWQNVLHAQFCIGFFLGDEGTDPKLPAPPASLDVILLNDLTAAPMSKADMVKYAKEMNIYAHNYLHGLKDNQLADIHAGFKSRTGMETTYAALVAALIGHHYYHFGMCDAALRDRGLQGLF